MFSFRADDEFSQFSYWVICQVPEQEKAATAGVVTACLLKVLYSLYILNVFAAADGKRWIRRVCTWACRHSLSWHVCRCFGVYLSKSASVVRLKSANQHLSYPFSASHTQSQSTVRSNSTQLNTNHTISIQQPISANVTSKNQNPTAHQHQPYHHYDQPASTDDRLNQPTKRSHEHFPGGNVRTNTNLAKHPSPPN